LEGAAQGTPILSLPGGATHPNPDRSRSGFAAFQSGTSSGIIRLRQAFRRRSRPWNFPLLVQQTAADRFRAWCAAPVAAEAEGATRDEALAKLTAEIETKTRGAEVVRVVIGWPIRSAPIWPDDEITRDWLEGIAAARAAADARPDPWDVP
jgi:hypothetical protein